MRIEFAGACVEISDDRALNAGDFMRCAEAAFIAAGFFRQTFADVVEEWLEDYRLRQAEPGLEV